jgi:hypothetical protein
MRDLGARRGEHRYSVVVIYFDFLRRKLVGFRQDVW